jgi:hypothetical protein
MIRKKQIIDDEIKTQSIKAIKRYIHDKIGDKPHNIKILSSVMGRDLFMSGRLSINCAESCSTISIEGDTQFSRDFHSSYSANNSIFNYCNGTLIITTNDKWGNKVELNISVL